MGDQDKTKAQLVGELCQLREKVAALERSEKRRKQMERALVRRTLDLNERVKELNCFYGMSELVENPDSSMHATVQGIVELIPSAWQYPGIAGARAVFDGKVYATDNFRETRWTLSSTIRTHGEPVGKLDVCYLEEKPERDEGPFCKEERRLLDAIAERLGRIIERRRAEEALRISEERFRALFEAANDCIFIKDRRFQYTLVNPAMERLLDMPRSRIIGSTAEDLYGEKAGKFIRQMDLRVLAGQSIEVEHTRPVGGMQVTFLDIQVPLRDDSDQIVGICGISRNITLRKKATPATPVTVEKYASTAMKACITEAQRAAKAESTILLLGESGSGKDYLARYIHDDSKRSQGPFFSINCAAIPGEIAESELFGHEPGAFTGARGRKRGLLELAEGGTLLLNEVGELPLPLQSKLLTFLDTKSFLRVGGEKSVHINARVMAASHRDLEVEADEGRFLKPLFYRLNVFSIRVPPLRERTEDIPGLVEDMVKRLATNLQLSSAPGVDRETIAAFQAYSWPGNVRELKNVLERELMLSGGRRISFKPPDSNSNGVEWCHKVRFPENKTLREITVEVSQAIVAEAVRRCGGNRAEAARVLGISRDSLYRFMK